MTFVDVQAHEVVDEGFNPLDALRILECNNWILPFFTPIVSAA